MKIDYSDPRISKLPRWAQEVIEEGRKAQESARYWQGRYRDQVETTDALRARYAEENGAPEYDTWVSEDLQEAEAEVANQGLGTGRPVYFGTDKTWATYTVRLEDGALDVQVESSNYLIRPNGYGKPTGFRVEPQ